ncbi:MAG: hypothetical protein OSA49_03215 [Ascidiaceihabitans sp.]|nr:hypothetical protein [Ascidiaceihabitans sp.]
MSNFHNRNDPRHKRLFELLRQKNVATHLVDPSQPLKVRKVNSDELDEIKRIATRSMTRAH